MKKLKVVVIGSNSFSGSDFVDLLLGEGSYDVAGISRSPEKSDLFLRYKARVSARNFRFYQMDLNRQMRGLLRFLDRWKPRWIVNFSTQSEVAPSWENPHHWFQTNCVALSELVNHLRKKRYVQRYLHVSTPEVYGASGGRLREETPMDPSTPYAVSRAAQDMFFKLMHERYGFPVVSVRAANVYGAGQQLWKIIPRSVIFIKMGRRIPLDGGGTASRSFVYVRDVSRGELAVLQKGRVGSIYHLAAGRNHKVREVVALVCRRMSGSFDSMTRSVGERPGQDAVYSLDCTRARRELGWEPRVSLERGVGEVVKWVVDNWNRIQKEPLEYVHAP